MSYALQRIVFVWNADFSLSGGLRALQELRAGEHSCQLCGIAYHRVRQTQAWKDYLRALQLPFRQPCRNQLSALEATAADGDFPAVLAHKNGSVIKLLGSDEINACDGAMPAFRQRLDAALAAHATP